MATNYRKMSTARLEAKMANGLTARERKMATREYGRRLDLKAASRSNGASVHIQIQGLVDKTAAELTDVLKRVLTEALGQIKTPRS